MPARGYSSTASTKRNRVPAKRAPQRDKLERDVAAQRAKVKRGRGVKADTGDVLRGSKVRRGERDRASRAELGQALTALAKPKRLTAPQRSALSAALSAVVDAPEALGKLLRDAPLIATGGGPAGALTARGKGRGGGLPIATAAQRPTTIRGTPVENLPKDALSFPKDAVLGLYEAGAAITEAAGGDTKRAKRLIAGVDDGALARLVIHGDPKGAAKAFHEHPLYSGLEVAGVGQVAGRGAGAVARSGAVGKGAKRAASTKRAPLRIEGTDQRVERRYSANLGVKAGQVARERSQRKRGIDPNVARGGVGGGQRSRVLNATVDEFAAQAEGTRRRGRVEMARAGARLAPARSTGRAASAVDRSRSRSAEGAGVGRGRAERAVVLAAVEGRLHGPKTFQADVKRERDRLQRVYVQERHEMSAATRRANREQVKALDRVLGDPKALANAGAVFRAADEYNAHAGRIERELVKSGALQKDQADAARVRTYGVAVMGLRPSERGLVDGSGRVVSTAEIQRTIREQGHREPGFVGHRRDQRGANAFFVNWFGSGRKTVDSKTRTGEAARTGGYDASFRALEEHLVRGQGVVDAVKTFDEFVGRLGTRRRDGTPFTWDEAQRAAGELAEATGIEFAAVRAVPARYDAATRQQILDDQGTAALPGNLDSLTVGRLDDSLKAPEGKERQARNVVLVPAQQVARFREHQTKGSGAGAKLAQAGTRVFRNTVLPFSTKWLTGNVAEAVLRSAAHGITPVDVVRGARVMRSLRGLDESAWRAADTRIRGGLLYGSADRLSVRRNAEDFEGTMFEGPAAGAAFVARLPVVRQIIGGLGVYTRAVFALNRGFERAFQTGVIGKAARKDAQELTGSWGKAVAMQQSVAQEVARGLLGTEKQVQFARYADEVLGKYSRFSPATRRAIQTFAPFLPWFINAGRFVAVTLPLRHPAKTALLANIEMTLQDDIEAHRKLVPPGDLESAIRRKDGGLVNIARYTPFGAFTNLPEGIVDPLLPQIDSAAKVLGGKSFTGKDLRQESGEPVDRTKRVWLALYTLLESSAPGVQIARRVREKGATPFDDSTVWSPKTKPGTKRGGAADRILNPVRPVYLSGGGGGSVPPAGSALEREGRALLRQQESAAAARQQRALEREARALLREQAP